METLKHDTVCPGQYQLAHQTRLEQFITTKHKINYLSQKNAK